jgi:lipoate-protein ligase A
MEEWRVIEDGPRGGELNMAIDMAILAACELREVPPTLRLYSWKQPTLTVGYVQDIDREIDLTRCRELGISVVR